MYFGRVVGSVWCTVKNPAMKGCRMLVVQPLTPELRNTGKPLICTDCTGAGAGELVYWVRGKEASFPFLPDEPPVDSTVVGIVDEVHVKRTLPGSSHEPSQAPSQSPAQVPAHAPAKPAAPVHRKPSRKSGTVNYES
jgi:ethanolamine utilization protein EutN